MAHHRTPHLLTATSLLAGLLTAGVVSAAPALADECPAGQVADGYTGECILDIQPVTFVDAPEGIHIHTGPNYGSGGIPTVGGIPCTPEHYGTCIGMSQNQVPSSSPQSTLSHSP